MICTISLTPHGRITLMFWNQCNDSITLVMVLSQMEQSPFPIRTYNPGILASWLRGSAAYLCTKRERLTYRCSRWPSICVVSQQTKQAAGSYRYSTRVKCVNPVVCATLPLRRIHTRLETHIEVQPARPVDTHDYSATIGFSHLYKITGLSSEPLLSKCKVISNTTSKVQNRQRWFPLSRSSQTQPAHMQRHCRFVYGSRKLQQLIQEPLFLWIAAWLTAFSIRTPSFKQNWSIVALSINNLWKLWKRNVSRTNSSFYSYLVRNLFVL